MDWRSARKYRVSTDIELTTDAITSAIMLVYENSCPFKVKKNSRVSRGRTMGSPQEGLK